MHLDDNMRRKIRRIEGNAKCRNLKRLTCKGTLRPGVCLSEAQNPILPPLTHCICVQYTVLLSTQGKGEGGRVEPERKLEGQQFTKLGRKYQRD
jgi:hypothetical protein